MNAGTKNRCFLAERSKTWADFGINLKIIKCALTSCVRQSIVGAVKKVGACTKIPTISTVTNTSQTGIISTLKYPYYNFLIGLIRWKRFNILKILSEIIKLGHHTYSKSPRGYNSPKSIYFNQLHLGSDLVHCLVPGIFFKFQTNGGQLVFFLALVSIKHNYTIYRGNLNSNNPPQVHTASGALYSYCKNDHVVLTFKKLASRLP